MSHDTISKITDGVLDEVKAWQTRPLEEIYPIIYLDALVVKVRDCHQVWNRAAHLAEQERAVLRLAAVARFVAEDSATGEHVVLETTGPLVLAQPQRSRSATRAHLTDHGRTLSGFARDLLLSPPRGSSSWSSTS